MPEIFRIKHYVLLRIFILLITPTDKLGDESYIDYYNSEIFC